MNKKYCAKRRKRADGRGFVALFTVTLIGFLAVIFTVASSIRVWTQSKSVIEASAETSARFDALSCLNIARLKIILGETPAEGEYYVKDGRCELEDVDVYPTRVMLRSVAVKDDVKVSLFAIINAETADIFLIRGI